VRRAFFISHLGWPGTAGVLALFVAVGCGGVGAKDHASRELDTTTVRQAMSNVFHGYRSAVIGVKASGSEIRITTTIDPGVDRIRALSRVYCEAINEKALGRDRVHTVRILGRRNSILREC
jgi:hypothetical protein